jgi:hypothetical protein
MKVAGQTTHAMAKENTGMGTEVFLMVIGSKDRCTAKV